MASIAVSSALVGENLFELLVYNIEGLVRSAGLSSASKGTVVAALSALVMVHCLAYVLLIHVMYAGLLGNSDFALPRRKVGPAPQPRTARPCTAPDSPCPRADAATVTPPSQGGLMDRIYPRRTA